MIAPLGDCPSCLQFIEDCECCESCGGLDAHEPSCDDAETRVHRRMKIEARKATLKGLQPLTLDDTQVNKATVVKVDEDEVSGVEPTGRYVAASAPAKIPTPLPPAPYPRRLTQASLSRECPSEESPLRAIIEGIRSYTDRGVPVEEAAERIVRRMPGPCARTMEVLGNWPSSEPELRALQKVWRR